MTTSSIENKRKAAAIEAASRYAQDKCLNLLSSAMDASSATSTSYSSGSEDQLTPPAISSKLVGATSPLSMSDDSVLFDDHAGDFGIDRHVVQAALLALGPEGRLSLSKTHTSSAGASGKRVKKKLSEMDEDERLLASAEAKKLTARQRRQIRNRVSARQFRLRRKEYISQLEGLVVNMTTKINGLERALSESRTDNKRLREFQTMTPGTQQQQQHRLQAQAPTEQPILMLPEYTESDALSFSNSFSGSELAKATEFLLSEPSLAASAGGSRHSSYSAGQNQQAPSPSSSLSSSNWATPSSADSIRMSPNVVNLLPPYPDQLMEWPGQQTMMAQSGNYISLPHTQIFQTKVPDLKTQLLYKKSNSEEVKIKKESDTEEEDKSIEKLADVLAESLFKRLDKLRI